MSLRTNSDGFKVTVIGEDRIPIIRLQQLNLNYLAGIRDSAKSGLGLSSNHHLNDLAESTTMNVRGSPETDFPAVGKRNLENVGATIVVRGWESQPHGEGSQSVGSFSAKVTEYQREVKSS
jgi:hypothetical protein